jgi:hypothetical protein
MDENGKTLGPCAFCGKRLTRGGMSRHLRTCAARRAATQAADAKAGKPRTLLHLVAQNRWSGDDFWLHLEMRGDAEIDDLDMYLRAIWLECCGHMSRFAEKGWRGEDIEMDDPAARVFTPDREITHTYDFGTETTTLIRLVGQRAGKPLSKHPITLMARNEMRAVVCQDCGEPATRLCLECVYQTDNAFLCDAHAESHPHEDYGEPVPAVNSPRLGSCAYDGPAEPPY